MLVTGHNGCTIPHRSPRILGWRRNSIRTACCGVRRRDAHNGVRGASGGGGGDLRCTQPCLEPTSAVGNESIAPAKSRGHGRNNRSCVHEPKTGPREMLAFVIPLCSTTKRLGDGLLDRVGAA
jgi:hypothetical protein